MIPYDHSQRRRRIFEAIVTAGVIILIVGGGVLNFQGFGRLQKNRERVRRSNEVSFSLEETVSVMSDAETGQRGFIITGDESYLEPFYSAMGRIDAVVTRLEALTVDDPVQQQKVPQLRDLIDDRIAELDTAITARREVGLDGGKAAVDTEVGKRTMDAVRAQIDDMRETEEITGVQRRAAAERSYQIGRWTTIMLTVAGLALVGGLLYLVDRNRRLDSQMRWFLEQIQDYAIFTMDAQCRATSWNQGVQQVLGYTREEFIGQNIMTMLFPSEALADGSAEAEFRTAEQEGVANDDRWMVRKGSELFWASGATNSITNERGKLVGYSKVMRDLTSRKQAQDELADLAAKLADADRRKDEFLATLAHELRNPLAPIMHAIELIGMYDLDTEVEELRQTMSRQTDQMVHLIDDLLDVSRISRGKIELRNQVVAMQTIIQSSVEATQAMIGDNDQQLNVQYDADSVFVNADPARITQVVSNLLTNASKYSGPGCKIQVNVDVEEAADRPWAVIRVSDNGIGIEPAQLAGIFNMFEQINNTLERGAAGLGIGLTLVRTLVEMHGGEVTAQSDGVGHGSTFIVRLPRIDAPDIQEARKLDLEPIVIRPFRILVVEDQRALRVVLSRLLEKMGHQVETAASGADAISVLNGYTPEVIFSDISMPGMTGYELVRRLRQRHDMEGVTIIAMTGYGQSNDRDQAFDSGFDEHLVKPVDAKILRKLFGELSQSHPEESGDQK